MKIALYVAELDVKGGTHKQVLRLAEHLVADGHDVEVFTPKYDPSKTYSGFADLTVRHLGDAHRGRILPYLRLAMRMSRYDVLHIHDNRGVAFFFLAKALFKARCVFWQINDLHPSFGQGVVAGRRLSRFSAIHRLLNRMMARRVDAITVNVSKNVQRVSTVLKITPRLFYCGVDIPPVATPDSDRQRAGTNRDRGHRLLSAGTFVFYRNYEVLVDAVAIAKSRLGKEIDLTIVGDTRYDPPYVDSVRKRAIDRSVELTVLENLSDAELRQQYEACDLFAFVNVDQSWGLAVFEAAAAFRPVVLSESVGAAEVLSEKSGFIIVDPLSASSVASGIVTALGDPALTAELGRSARAAVEEMTWASSYASPVAAMYRASLQ